HQAAHGRRALLGEKVALRTVGADGLALALPDAQGGDDRRTEQEDEEQRRDRRRAGAEGDVAEDVERLRLHQLAEKVKHQIPCSRRPLSAPSRFPSAKRCFSASTTGPRRLPFDPLTITTSPGARSPERITS